MELGTIQKSEIGKLLAKAGGKGKVFAPVMGLDEPEFGEYTGGKELVLEGGNPKISPKGVFFPQTETLLTFDYDTIEEIPIPEGSILLFGSRPCDTYSLTLLDRIFDKQNKGYYDPYYMKRREKSLVISMACNNPCPTCFCSSVGSGPGDEKGADILAFDRGETVLFKALTEKGKGLMSEQSPFFKEASGGDLEKAEAVVKDAEQKMGSLDFEPETLKKIMDAAFEDEVWDRITRSCIGCGACTYLCPTCYCFDISDEQKMYKGKRIRTWDSCQYPQFTKHASGHNPRTNKLQRLRQRFMHKFSYTVENADAVFCVGCGRCITNCPVNIDIREVIKTFSTK